MQQTQLADWRHVQDAELLAQMAAQAALDSNWQEAAEINQKILSIAQNDVEALNRLARAMIYLGQLDKAQKTYKKALEIDPYNVIARKNLDKIASVSSSQTNGGAAPKFVNFAPNLSKLFLSEPGKTKVINLLNLASPSALAVLNYGEQLSIVAKSHAVNITTQEGVYLGCLPDDLAHKLISFISGGNQYEAYVKSVTPKSITIFIRETFRSSRFTNQPSFQSTQISYFDSEQEEA